MPLPTADQLPTSVVGLVAFITIAFTVGLITIVSYFLRAQKTQTNVYMLYIQTKNGHLEKAREDFGKMIEDARNSFAATLMEQSNSHRAMLEDAMRRIQLCQEGHTT